MSATYKCRKCGLEGWSKNIHTRSLFTEDSVSSMMCSITNISTSEPNEHGNRTVTLEFPYSDTPNKNGSKMSSDELQMEAVKLIHSLTMDQLTHWLCDHDWEHVSGEELNSSW